MKYLLLLSIGFSLSIAFTQPEFSSNDSIIQQLNTLGNTFRKSGNTEFAIRCFSSGLQLAKRENNKELTANNLYELGVTFSEQKDYAMSIGFFKEAIRNQEKNKLYQALSNTYHKLGKVYVTVKNYTQGITSFKNAINAAVNTGDSLVVGLTKVELGKTYLLMEERELALKNYTEALAMLHNLNDEKGIADVRCKLGEYYIITGNIPHAIVNLEESYRISEKLGEPDLIKHSSHLLSLAYEKKGDGLLSVKLYKRYAFMKDSMEHDETRKAKIRREIQFEFEKQRMVEQQLLAEKEKMESVRISRRNRLQYSIMFLFILVGFGAIISLGYLKISQRVSEIFIFVSVLVFFEFLLILTDPLVDQFTGGIPVYKLLSNCLMAFMVFPLHTLFEKKLKRRIIK